MASATRIHGKYADARRALHELERDRNIKIVHACESGSRGWGFASKDSDYDVRFIYVRPTRSYLSLAARRDVIDQNDLPPRRDDIDLAGWDVLKALELSARSNPQVLEWLLSPVQYYEHRPFVDELREILGEFNPRALAHHYSSMAKRTYMERIRGVGETVKYKKYLYALRPIMCCLALEARPLVFPPVDFKTLLDEVEVFTQVRPILGAVHDLLRLKGDGAEADEQKRIKVLEDFIVEQVPRTRAAALNIFDGRQPDMLRLEALSVAMIREFGSV